MSSTTTSTTINESSSTVTQYGFFFDQSRCIACHACAVACKDWNNVSAGPGKPLRIFDWEEGTFPSQRINTLFAPCYHCQDPVCVSAANGAMYKEPTYGAVLIDPNQVTSSSLRAAWEACPYGAISFDSDAPDATAYKCNMCIDRLLQGNQPICVMACPMRALDFGLLDQMTAKYGDNQQLEGMPAATTQPAIVFKPMDQQKSLVPYDQNSAISLLGGSTTTKTGTTTSATTYGTVRKNQLVLKPQSVEDFMYYTRSTEG